MLKWTNWWWLHTFTFMWLWWWSGDGRSENISRLIHVSAWCL